MQEASKCKKGKDKKGANDAASKASRRNCLQKVVAVKTLISRGKLPRASG